MGNRGTMDAKKAEEDEMKTIKELQDHRVVDGAPVAALGVIEIPSAGRYTRRIVRANCRIGRCRKLGSSSFPSRDPHQCWAVWA